MSTESSEPASADDSQIVVFGPYRLDRAARRLWRDGQTVELSQRGFALLCLLIDHRERALSRRELLDTLWGQRIVTDNTLSQLISALRRALSDSADDPRWIRTVHGFGVQWIGSIETLSVDSQPIAVAKRWPRWRYTLLLVAMLAIGAGYWLGRADQPPSIGSRVDIVGSDKMVLALMPILVDEQAESRLLALALGDYVTERMVGVPGLVVMAPDELRRLMTEPSVDTVRSALDPEFILEAHLRAADSPERAQLEARVIRRDGTVVPLTNRSIALPSIPNDFAYFFNARQAFVEELANIVSPGAVVAAEIDGQLTDPEALRLGLSADRILRSTLCDHQQLEQQLRTAITKAPESAYLWWLLGNHYFTRVWGCGEPVALLEQAFAAAANADRLAPGRYSASAQLRHTYLLETARIEEAYAYALEHDDGSLDGRYRLALSLRYAGFVQAAARIARELIAEDPLYFFQGRYGRAPNSLLYLDAWDEFTAAIPVSGPYHSYYHGFVRTIAGDETSARTVLNKAFREFPSDMFGSLSQALLAYLDRDSSLAIEAIRQVAMGRSRLPLRDGEVTFKEAQLLALSDDPDGALQRLELALEQGFFCPRCLADDYTLATVNDDDRYKALFEQATARHLAFAERFELAAEIPSPAQSSVD